MNATKLAKELNKRGNMKFLSKDEKMLKRDIRQLWMSGAINGDKESHNCLGRTKFKLDDVKFCVVTCEREILFFVRQSTERRGK